VEQRKVTMDEWRVGVESGDIVEMFACGTAAVITPIGEIKSDTFTIGDITAPPGELTMALRQELTDIQYGRLPDRHGWLTRLDA
jgi:branched-chain amino acid aminotransferase